MKTFGTFNTLGFFYTDPDFNVLTFHMFVDALRTLRTDIMPRIRFIILNGSLENNVVQTGKCVPYRCVPRTDYYCKYSLNSFGIQETYGNPFVRYRLEGFAIRYPGVPYQIPSKKRTQTPKLGLTVPFPYTFLWERTPWRRTDSVQRRFRRRASRGRRGDSISRGAR